MKRAIIVVLFGVVLFGCAPNPRNVLITAKNKDTFMEEIKDMKGLTVGESWLLGAFQMRRSIGGALGSPSEDSVGKTVGELLVKLKKQAADQKTEADRQKGLADDAKAKADAIAAELRKSIDLTVYHKKFTPSNPMAGRYSDELSIACAYQNNSNKDIRAFRGRVQFADLFGSEIYTTRLTVSDPVSSGKKATWYGVIKYNQFLREHEQLKNTALKDMKIDWSPESVIFADGSQVGETK